MELTSPAILDGQTLPTRYTCDGSDISPPLSWTGVPRAARTLAILLEEPDASFRPATYWLVWGIDPDTPGIAEGQPAVREGRNDFGAPGYRGPCPPAGAEPRRYVFRLLALDAETEILGGSDRRSFERAVEGHVLAAAELAAVHGR